MRVQGWLMAIVLALTAGCAHRTRTATPTPISPGTPPEVLDALTRLTAAQASVEDNPTLEGGTIENLVADKDLVVGRGDLSEAQQARNLLGVIYMYLKQYPAALKTFRTMEFDKPDSQASLYRYNLGRAYERTGKSVDALKEYGAALRIAAAPDIVTAAADGIKRVLQSAGPAPEVDFGVAVRACSALLEGGLAAEGDTCFREQLKVRKGQPNSERLLDYVLWRFSEADDEGSGGAERVCADVPKVKGCPDDLAGVEPSWGPALGNIRLAMEGTTTPELETVRLQQKFSAWKTEEGRVALSEFLEKLGTKFRERATTAKGAESQEFYERAFSSYAQAWTLTRMNIPAATRAADIYSERYPRLPREPMLKLARGVAATSGSAPAKGDWQGWAERSALYASLGDALSLERWTPCRDASSPEDALFYWWRALDAEARSNGQAGVPMRPDQVNALYAPLSSSRYTNRRLADCLAPLPLRARYDSGARFEHHVNNNWLFHSRAIAYPGALAKVSLFAAVEQAANSPAQWGRHGTGFLRRMGSGAGTRAIRQMMGFGIDSVLREDPEFLHSRYPGFWTRINHASVQTAICRNDRLQWTPAVWRIASAIGAEFVSNAWRPRGGGVGDRGTAPALKRAAISLGTDTISNVLREFIPASGRLAPIIRVFE